MIPHYLLFFLCCVLCEVSDRNQNIGQHKMSIYSFKGMSRKKSGAMKQNVSQMFYINMPYPKGRQPCFNISQINSFDFFSSDFLHKNVLIWTVLHINRSVHQCNVKLMYLHLLGISIHVYRTICLGGYQHVQYQIHLENKRDKVYIMRIVHSQNQLLDLQSKVN